MRWRKPIFIAKGGEAALRAKKMVDADGDPLDTRPKTRTEHLSSLKESYLQQLAGETGLIYARLRLPANLANLLAQRREWSSNTGYPPR